MIMMSKCNTYQDKHSAVQRQKPVTAHLQSEPLLLFSLADQRFGELCEHLIPDRCPLRHVLLFTSRDRIVCPKSAARQQRETFYFYFYFIPIT